ncbi:hypothetical protein [Actinoplanes sp. NPDC049681]|uniref:hypothetical protein n=1 Tax=Actinoplanes sp. NPDC049681 TaxID=3363905 RepID=UPI00378F3F45
MRTVIVQRPGGGTWRVRVVWEPRWRALARRFGGWRRRRTDGGVGDLGVDLPSGSGGHHGGGGGGGGWGDLGDDIVVGIAVIVGMIVVGVLFWWLLLPLLLLVLDVVAVVALVVVGVAGRVLFRRPWTVQARGPAGAEAAAAVVGWRAALRTRDEIADKIRLGFRPEEAVRASVGVSRVGSG